MSRAIPKWELVEGDLATPLGFRAAAAAAGIKKTRDALDLALIFSDSPATTAAGVFTTNRVAAAPVLLSRQNLIGSRGLCRAIVANAGNANACTGKEGMHAAEETARVAAELLGIEPTQVLVASTGVIGVPLNLDLVLQQLPHLKDKLSRQNARAVAQAIMTTDTVPKSCVVRSDANGRAVHIAAVAKGSGMINPHMATMLSFITTDAAMGERMLHNLLRAAAEDSFNRVTVDVREPGSPVTHEVQVLPREVAENADERHNLYEKAREGDQNAAAEMKAANEAHWQAFQSRQTSEPARRRRSVDSRGQPGRGHYRADEG